jgi:2-oxo-4-hydroxy-4-carboxy-5-ureidoimidazoline decarboxylase
MQLALIRAHPELAGKAAGRGELTADSTSEQSGAGLTQCTPDEFARLAELNAAYNENFGFPFILAVRGRDRAAILSEFARRVVRDRDAEFKEALTQIARIARLRLDALFADG